MKVSSVILTTILTGGLIAFATKKDNTTPLFEKDNTTIIVPEEELNKEVDVFANKVLGREISFEDAFEISNQKTLEPQDIIDIEEEEIIVLDMK